jgi:hypothetical protein
VPYEPPKSARIAGSSNPYPSRAKPMSTPIASSAMTTGNEARAEIRSLTRSSSPPQQAACPPIPGTE